MGSLTGGPFIVAYAAHIGGSNALVGFLAALPFLAQVLQLPVAAFVARFGRRRRIVMAASIPGRLVWLVPAAAPWFMHDDLALGLILGVSMAVHFGLASVATCAYSSWIRDIVPEKLFGQHFGRQLALGTAIGAALRLGAGPTLDLFSHEFAHPAQPYLFLFSIAAALGVVGTLFLRKIDDPKPPRPNNAGLAQMFAAPLRSKPFRSLLFFGAAWSFAINLAAPFVTLYMLKRVSMSMTWIVGLSVLSKLVNVMFFPIWGKLSDRFANKSVLGVSVSLSILVMLAWPFTTLPERHAMTIPILVLIFAAAGISTAGVTLGLNNIALKFAPRGEAAPFLAANAMFNGVASAVSPLIAGLAADFLADERLTLSLAWTFTGGVRFAVGALDFRGLDFLFVASAVLSLYALHRLSLVREEGEVQERIVLDALYGEVRQAVREVSSLSGLNRLVEFPSGVLHWAAQRTRLPMSHDEPPEGVEEAEDEADDRPA